MLIRDGAIWFFNNNSSLKAYSYGSNVKLNKLLYLTHLMFYAIYNEKLFVNADFIKFKFGPINQYVRINFNNLKQIAFIQRKPIILLTWEQKIIFYIINYVYGALNYKELSKITHLHNLYRITKFNETLNIKNISNHLILHFNQLFTLYKNMDFLHEKYIRFDNVILYYNDQNLSKQEITYIKLKYQLDHKYDEFEKLKILKVHKVNNEIVWT